MPRVGPDREAWLRNGTMPGDKPISKKADEPKPGESKADPTPAKDQPDSGSDSGSDKPNKQVARAKTPEDTGIRLAEIIEDLRRAGITPKELKTFKREQQQQAPASEPTPPPSKAAEAPPAPPSAKFTKPEPELKNFDDVADFVKAHSKWTIESYEFDREQREQRERLDADVKSMRAKAAERYGPDYETPLKHAAEQIFTKDGGAIPSVIKQMFNDSDVLPDLLYTLGTKAEDLAAFVSLAKTDAGKAIRKLVIMEGLIREELAKPKVATEAVEETEVKAPTRGEDGKFVKAEESEPEPAKPAKKITQAPPPPLEAGGIKTAPPDDLEAAYQRVADGHATPKDTALIFRLENEREIKRRKAGR